MKQINEITFETVNLVNSLCLFKGEPHCVVNKKAIESAIGNQYQPYETEELAYASVYKSLVLNHGFMNGNKRTAVIVLYLFSLISGKELKLNDQEFADLTYRIAGENGGQIPVEMISSQVFSGQQTSKENRLNDIEKQSIEFIKKHQWLMKELGK